MDAQEVCLVLNISKRSLQSYREYGIIPCSFIGGKYVYKESDLARILTQKGKQDMDGVITKQSEEYIRMMEMLKKCSKEIFAIQDLPVPVANEVYMTGEQVCGMLHISSRTLQKLRDEKGIAYTAIGGKFLYPLSKLQLLLEENYRSYVR